MASQSTNRCGTTYLELQVAMILLATSVTGLVPMVVVQSRQAARLTGRVTPGQTEYVNRSATPWDSKLGIPATLAETQVIDAPTLRYQIRDNDDAEFKSREFTLTSYSTAFNENMRYRWGTWENDRWCEWKFKDLQSGDFEVFVTYPTYSLASTASQFRVYDKSTYRGGRDINQRVVADDFIWEGRGWESLGTFNIQNGELRVRLTDNADYYIFADAVMIQPRRNTVQVLSLDEADRTTTATVQVKLIP